MPRSVNPRTGIKGFDIVLNNLNREIQNIQGRTMKGLIEAAMVVRRDMDATPPLIPVDLGNLRASWFISTYRSSDKYKIFKTRSGAFTEKARTMGAQHVMAQEVAKGLGKDVIALVMGFSANYAMYVHEMLDPKIKWKRPGSGPKFFEASLKRNALKMVYTIMENAKIRK